MKNYPGIKATGMRPDRAHPSDGRSRARGVSRPKHLRKRKMRRG